MAGADAAGAGAAGSGAAGAAAVGHETTQHDVTLRDGRVLRVHDVRPRDSGATGTTGTTGATGTTGTVVWHHGSPQSGAPLAPLVAACVERGLRLVTFGRAGYGGSTPHPGRSVAAVADDVADLADALDLGPFAVLGASGGGPHALACAALLPGRVTAAVTFAGLAPLAGGTRSDGPAGAPAWWAGMADDGGLRAALDGREARARHGESAEFDPSSFTAADWAALEGRWSSLGADAAPAGAAWPDAFVDDDVAFVRPWGFDLGAVDVPVLLVQGDEDRVVPPAHARMLLDALPEAELWEVPGAGHVSVLEELPAALDALLD
ncbi:alpha/beta hydrolase [Sediminihabitans luteus]|nr:alpha/beta hydrolase [Sediminihabitans luteus]